MEKIRQHYVSRFYLKPWAENDQIWCLRDRKIFSANLMKIANEKYFYELRDLSPEDMALIERFAIAQSPEHLRPLHRNFLKSFSLPWEIKKNAERIGRVDPTLLSMLDETIANMEENYQMAIENSLQPFLISMLQGSTDFYANDEKASEFLYAISVQYLRTKKIREAIIAQVHAPFRDIRRAWNVLSHITATNMGWSLFANRANFQIVLLDNLTGTPFITGDQPLINSQANPLEDVVTTGLEFFYPLCPSKAMLFSEASNHERAAQSSISAKEVHHYNVLIARNSLEQVFSNAEESLKVIQGFI